MPIPTWVDAESPAVDVAAVAVDVADAAAADAVAPPSPHYSGWLLFAELRPSAEQSSPRAVSQTVSSSGSSVVVVASPASSVPSTYRTTAPIAED